MRPLIAVVLFVIGIGGVSSPQSPSERQRATGHYREGWRLLTAEKWKEAETEFRKAIEIVPRYELAHYGLGRTLMAQKRYTEATLAFTTSRDLYVAAAGAKFNSEMDANQQRRDKILELRDSIRELQRAPQTRQTVELIRQLEIQINNLERAIDRGSPFTSESQVPAFVYLALGSAYFRSERLPDAEREYRAAIAADPKYGEAHNNLAVVYLLTDRPDLAEAEVELAERAGYRVNPALKDDIRKAKR